MANRELKLSVNLDASQFFTEAGKIVNNLDTLLKALEKVGGAQANFANLSRAAKAFRDSLQSDEAYIRNLDKRVALLQNAIRVAESAKKDKLSGPGSTAATAYLDQPKSRRALGLDEAKRALEQLKELSAEAKQRLVDSAGAAQQFGNSAAQSANLAGKGLRNVISELDKLVTSERAGKKFVANIDKGLQAEVGYLSRLRGELIAAAAQEIPGRAGLRDVERLAREEQRWENLERKIRATQAALDRYREALDEGDADALAGMEPEDVLIERLKNLEAGAGASRKQIEELKKPVDAIIDSAGLRPFIESLDKAILGIEEFQNVLSQQSTEAFPKRVRDELDAIVKDAQSVKGILSSDKATYEDKAAALSKWARIQERIKELSESETQELLKQKSLTQEIKDRGSAGVFRDIKAGGGGQSRLDKIVYGFTEDFSRRFIQTFQYAFSAAIQFALINAAKKFAQIAIEAERAFEDIATNLEFDIEAERGTGAFSQELERVRQNVFALANDINILPSEASRSAYVMVARFGDVNRALQATRAQLLATQVSGISQEETLRALTAVAESFASTLYDTNEALSETDRLMVRERNSVLLYTKALDYAVRIQQLYGIETEDSLEGVARSAETFKALGFSIEETFAIVSAVSRKLGQPGVQVAERLNRAFSGLTDPTVRDSILEVAARSEDLKLTLEDFEDGSKALEALDAQFQSLLKNDPEALQRLIQEFGQRREAEVVAAVLDTGDLRKQIEDDLAGAAGAAEDRYEILKKTVVEILESINAQFETLATNIAKLGAITPLKVLLESFDKLLSLINSALDGLNSFKEILNSISIGGKGIGTLTVEIASLIFALKSAGRLFSSLSGRFGGPLAIAGAYAGGTLSRITGGRLGQKTFEKNAAKAADALDKTGSSATRLGVSLSTLASMAVAAAFAIGLIIDLVKTRNEAREYQQQLVQDQTDVFNELRRQVLSGDISGTDARISYIQQQLDLVGQQPEIASELDQIYYFILDLVDFQGRVVDLVAPNGRTRVGNIEIPKWFYEIFTNDTAEDFDLYGVGRTRMQLPYSSRQPGTEEFRKKQLIPIVEDGIAAYVDAFWEVINEVSTIDDPSVRDFTSDRIRIFKNIERQLNEATDPDERRKLYEELGKLYEETRQRAEEVRNAGLDVEGTSAQILASVQQVTSDVQAGIISMSEARALLTDKIQQLGRILEWSFGKQGYEDDLNNFNSAIQEWVNEIEFELQRDVEQITSITERFGATNEIPGLQAEIAAIDVAIGKLVQGGVVGAEKGKLAELLQRKETAQYALAAAIRQEAVRMGELKIANARTDAEYFAAVEELIRTYKQQARQIESDLGKFVAAAFRMRVSGSVIAAAITSAAQAVQAIGEAIDILRQAEDDRQFQAGVDKARIRKIMKYKPLDPLAQIEGELAAVYAERSRQFENDARELENLQRERELIAQKNMLLLGVWSAQVLAGVKVGDSMTELKAQISIAAETMKRTEIVMGQATEEYWTAVRQYKELLNTLYEQELALHNYERLLGLTDISSAYETASAALQYVIDQLANPNLGDLERAQLEVEKRKAELDKEAAFINSNLLGAEFAFESGELSESGYLAFLKQLLAQVDTTTEQGKQLWLQINGLIEGLTNDVTDLAFNIPDQIRLPTLFEIRRAVEADQLGVNYLDNRQQEVNLYVSNEVDVAEVLKAVDSIYGSSITTQSKRYAPGSAGMTTKEWL